MATGSFAGTLSLAQAAAESASTPQPSHFAALRPILKDFMILLSFSALPSAFAASSDALVLNLCKGGASPRDASKRHVF
jgi:hypothetical protein